MKSADEDTAGAIPTACSKCGAIRPLENLETDEEGRFVCRGGCGDETADIAGNQGKG